MLEGLKWKVTKYEHATFNELEMADDKRLGGASDAPPVFLGLMTFNRKVKFDYKYKFRSLLEQFPE